MPRKYHRPPTAKRRKGKKTTSPNVLEPLPESQTDNSAAVISEEDAGETAAAVEVDDYVDRQEEYEVAPAPGMAKKERAVRHLVADYGYVLTELRLSIGLALFLLAALIITGILR